MINDPYFHIACGVCYLAIQTILIGVYRFQAWRIK